MALVAITLAGAWQIAGTLALFRLTPRPLGESKRLLLAWSLWLPVSGVAVLALVLAHLASRGVLLAGTVIVLLIAASSASIARAAVARLRLRWTEWRATATPAHGWLFGGGCLLQIITWVHAGHPQRMIDQVNYHLVVGHLVVRDGQPFTATSDPHVFFSGIVEYGLAWHQAWTHSTLLFVALAQVAVMLATVPVLIACGLIVGEQSLVLLGVLLFAIPAVIPEATVLRTAKPDGIILTAVVLLLTFLAEETEGWLLLATAVLALALAAKITAIHAAIGLAACCAVWRPRRGRPADFVPLLVIGLAALALQWGKNAAYLGDPFYPVGAGITGSPAWDDTAREYWNTVAFDGRPRWSGWLGPLLYAWRGGTLVACVVAALVCSRGAREPRRSRFLHALLAFAGAYVLAWPIFYGDRISPRFLAPLTAVVLVIWWSLQPGGGARFRPWLWTTCVVAALLTSQLDVIVPRLSRWDRVSAAESYAQQYSKFRTATALGPELGVNDALIADRPEKLLFEARLICDSPYSPRDRAELEELRQHPAEVARRLRLKAIVVDGAEPMSASIAAAWKALEPHGTERRIGSDRVLWSSTYFQPLVSGQSP